MDLPPVSALQSSIMFYTGHIESTSCQRLIACNKRVSLLSVFSSFQFLFPFNNTNGPKTDIGKLFFCFFFHIFNELISSSIPDLIYTGSSQIRPLSYQTIGQTETDLYITGSSKTNPKRLGESLTNQIWLVFLYPIPRSVYTSFQTPKQ